MQPEQARTSHPAAAQHVMMRNLLRAYYWMDESLQNGMTSRGRRTRTRTQTMILINVFDGVTRAADLARMLGISRQAVQQQIVDLERDGVVTQVPDPSDRRANLIRFSPQGQELIDAALASLAEAERLLEQRLGPEILDGLRAALARDWGPVLGDTRAPGRKRRAEHD